MFMGKNWACGLTKATDARVARAARGHVGLRYRRHELRPDRRRRYAPVRVPRDEQSWTGELAYAVGLLATDGGLTGGKTVVLVSKDKDQIETFRSCVRTDAPIRMNRGIYRVQITDVNFFRWLESIGVTRRKSLTLGAVRVPDHLFLDFTRGLLDGDGSVKNSLVVPNPRRYPHHTYQRLRVEFHSASLDHVTWLRAELRRLIGLEGWIGVKRQARRSPLFVLRYSKHESIAMLSKLYADPAAPRLARKWMIWINFRENGKPTRIWTRRRSVGTGQTIRIQDPAGASP